MGVAMQRNKALEEGKTLIATCQFEIGLMENLVNYNNERLKQFESDLTKIENKEARESAQQELETLKNEINKTIEPVNKKILKARQLINITSTNNVDSTTNEMLIKNNKNLSQLNTLMKRISDRLFTNFRSTNGIIANLDRFENTYFPSTQEKLHAVKDIISSEHKTLLQTLKETNPEVRPIVKPPRKEQKSASPDIDKILKDYANDTQRITESLDKFDAIILEYVKSIKIESGNEISINDLNEIRKQLSTNKNQLIIIDSDMELFKELNDTDSIIDTSKEANNLLKKINSENGLAAQLNNFHAKYFSPSQSPEQLRKPTEIPLQAKQEQKLPKEKVPRNKRVRIQPPQAVKKEPEPQLEPQETTVSLEEKIAVFSTDIDNKIKKTSELNSKLFTILINIENLRNLNKDAAKVEQKKFDELMDDSNKSDVAMNSLKQTVRILKMVPLNSSPDTSKTINNIIKGDTEITKMKPVNDYLNKENLIDALNNDINDKIIESVIQRELNLSTQAKLFCLEKL